MSNEIIEKKTEEQFLANPKTIWTKEFLNLVKEVTAKNCTEEEFKLLVYTSKLYNLNPLRKEIYFIKYQNSTPILMVSHAGLISLAHRTGQFGAMETTFEFSEKDNFLPKKPVSATTKVWRKDYDKPFSYTAYWLEFNRGMALWKEKPCVMLQKCSEANALRRAFDVAGLYVEEEMPPKENRNVVDMTEYGSKKE